MSYKRKPPKILKYDHQVYIPKAELQARLMTSVMSFKGAQREGFWKCIHRITDLQLDAEVIDVVTKASLEEMMKHALLVSIKALKMADSFTQTFKRHPQYKEMRAALDEAGAALEKAML